MPPGDDAGLAAWRAVQRAHDAALRAIDAELARARAIPLSWYDVLAQLRSAPAGRLQMQELGHRVLASRTRVSRLVDEMATHALVDKIRDDDDRRVIWATITPNGLTAHRATAPLYLRGIQAHFCTYLTDDEKAVIADALSRVASREAIT